MICGKVTEFLDKSCNKTNNWTPRAIHLEAIIVWRMCAAEDKSDRHFRELGHRNIKAIQGH